MTKWRYTDDVSDDDDQATEQTDTTSMIARRERGKMPVASEARAKAEARATYRSRLAQKRVGRTIGGIRNRHRKDLDREMRRVH